MALLIQDVPIECINQSAVTYHVPAKLIISVLRTEGGKQGSAILNRNGTYDYGPMQINSRWLKELKYYGYDANILQNNPCLNVKIGTWILGKSIAAGKTLWYGIGNYHSYTPYYNMRYQSRVIQQYECLNHYLIGYRV